MNLTNHGWHLLFGIGIAGVLAAVGVTWSLAGYHALAFTLGLLAILAIVAAEFLG